MLVVSNIDIETTASLMKPERFLGSAIKDFTLNLNCDYRYLKTGYYVSMHAEVLGNTVLPTSESIIDANRTPILLLKASRAGIPTMPYLVTSSIKQMMTELGFPLVVFAVNPFSFAGYKTAKNRSALYRAVKSLSANYKFAVCVQPLKGEMTSVKSLFGRCQQDEQLGEICSKVYDVFKIPVCKIHVQRVEQKAYLCGLQPLRKEELLADDLKVMSEEVACISKIGDPAFG